MSDLTTRLLAEIERREGIARAAVGLNRQPIDGVSLAYLAALRKIVETSAEWRHEVVDDCWYTCAAATEDRDGGECCDDSRRGAACDCGLDHQRGQILAAVAEALGVEA